MLASLDHRLSMLLFTWGTFIRRTFNMSYVHCPTRHRVGATRYPIVWWRRLVKVWSALLLVYSMLHLDYDRFWINGGKQSLNRFSREARRTGEIHPATGQFPWHPALRVRWRSCLTPGSSSILNKFCFFINKICFFININQVSNRTTQPSRSSAFWSTNGTWLRKREPMFHQSF